jgi:biotin transport system substrate-specific component
MKNKWKTKDLTNMALFVAFLAVSALITIPFGPIPFTLQTVLVYLIGLLLSPLQGFVTLATYLLLGAVGLPIFSGATGGFGKLFGPTGGFLFGFMLAAPSISFAFRKIVSLLENKNKITLLSSALFSLCLIGTPISIWIGYFIYDVFNKNEFFTNSISCRPSFYSARFI